MLMLVQGIRSASEMSVGGMWNVQCAFNRIGDT